jgi:hypothetical protein
MAMITQIDCLTLLVVKATTVAEATVAEASSTSSAFLHRMNRDHNMLQPPMDDIQTGEQQAEDVHSKISNQPGEGDKDKSDAISARIDDTPATGPAPAGEEEDLLLEATPILMMLSSNSRGLRKQGVATTAHATLLSKKKKVAVQCPKGAHVKVTKSHLFHVLDHDVQRDTLLLKGYGNSQNFIGQLLSGSGEQSYNI